MRMTRLFIAVILIIGMTGFLFGLESINAEMNVKIRDEAMFRSQIMLTMHYLTDVYGPRLTGSPNYKAAAEWTLEQMKKWGLENAHLERWDFGHPGWTNERLSAHILAPYKDQLVCKAVAWTPSTAGTVAGSALVLELPEKPSAAELDQYFNGVRDKVKGRVVFIGKPQAIPITLNPPARRRDDQQVRALYDPKNPNAGLFFGRPEQRDQRPDPSRLTAAQIGEKLDQFLVAAGALVKVTEGGKERGEIRVFGNRTYDPEKSTPAVAMRNEDYGRITRLLADGASCELEFNIVNKVHPEGRTTFNAVAELPGSDKVDEVVMLGAHLDSWHGATGATDNAIGCAIMMEAARILKVLGVRPRRTVRVALWSAEEQGLLGSQAYVKEHFGSFESPKPEFAKLVGYFNIDSGTGRIRGGSIFGPPAAAAVLREILAPFEDLGVAGVLAAKSRRLGGTDSTSFNQAGLPGIGMSQDPIEYFTDTWHTNVDSYERVLEDDAKAASTSIASAVYHLAMREENLPRFTKEEMPPAPRPEGQQAGPPRP